MDSTESKHEDPIPFGEEPYVPLDGSDAWCFIQWKGTDLCMDLKCSCGVHSHIDEDFVYFIACPGCETVYEMGTQVILKRSNLTTSDLEVKMASD